MCIKEKHSASKQALGGFLVLFNSKCYDLGQFETSE